jgi:hypothetical protein
MLQNCQIAPKPCTTTVPTFKGWKFTTHLKITRFSTGSAFLQGNLSRLNNPTLAHRCEKDSISGITKALGKWESYVPISAIST